MFQGTKKEQSLEQESSCININTNVELSQIYQYLLANCYGYDNRLKAYQIMREFDIKDHKLFRNRIEDIRQSNEYGFICSEAGTDGGYWIPANYDEVQVTLNHIFKRAMEMLKTYSILRRKVRTKGIK